MSDPITPLNAALEGRYRIESELGEGGMATVYLADDIKHERQVALKVLKPELAAVVGAERFLAEIKTTANLTHPHILPLHDSGEADSFVFYVMPYVEGESLRDKLDREHQLPVDDAVRIASDVAEALDYAHAQGVIHRDIKPANILIQAGRPVIADFGIAMAVGAGGADRLTQTGMSVGTPHYMSPEQASGDQTAGPATDTYALGCVLYEMLVGEPPYTGRTARAIQAKIMMGESVSATKTRASVPANVDDAIRKALEKLPADRFRSAQRFAAALTDPGFRHGAVAEGEARASELGPAALWRGRLHWGLTTALAATAIVLGAKVLDGPANQVFHSTVPLGQDAAVYLGGPDNVGGRPGGTALAFSPDGDLLVYAGGVVGVGNQLYLRRLDQAQAQPIPGTEDGGTPFFSPEGTWIGFRTAQGALKRVSVAGGDAETVAHDPRIPRGATWGDDGTIVVGFGGSLYRVAGTGGELELLAEPEGEQVLYLQPHMLPGSAVVLFHLARSPDPEHAEIVALDLASGARKTVLENAMDPRYVKTGHLLFMRQGTLMAVEFDPKRLEVKGPSWIMVEDVMHSIFMPLSNNDGAAQVAVSASGHLAFARGGVYPVLPRTVRSVTSTGDTTVLDMGRRRIWQIRVSPEDDRLLFSSGTSPMRIWVHDLVRGVTQRVNTGGFRNHWAEWSPDGRSLAFTSDREQFVQNVYRARVDGSGEPERLAPSDRQQIMSSWSSKGTIAWLEPDSSGALDIWVLPPDGDPAPFFTSEDGEGFATFSPDGNWLAYTAPGGIFVRPYPGPEPATLISDGGTRPAWSRDGRRIYYVQGGVVMAVDVTPGDELGAGRAVPLPGSLALAGGRPVRGYDVFADGSFVTFSDDDDRSLRERVGATELHVVLNWLEELKERVGN